VRAHHTDLDLYRATDRATFRLRVQNEFAGRLTPEVVAEAAHLSGRPASSFADRFAAIREIAERRIEQIGRKGRRQ
jgi:hypothetical protein